MTQVRAEQVVVTTTCDHCGKGETQTLPVGEQTRLLGWFHVPAADFFTPNRDACSISCARELAIEFIEAQVRDQVEDASRVGGVA